MMTKRLTSILLTTVLMLSMLCLSFVSVNAEVGNSADGEYYTYYFYAPKIMFNTSDSLGYYYWAPEENAKWPGVELTKEEACVHEYENGDRVFKVQIWQENENTENEEVTTPTIVFNSFVDGKIDPVNAIQTSNVSLEGFYEGVNAALEYNEFAYGTDEAKYPHYTEDVVSYNFNNMIYVPTDPKETQNAFGDTVTGFESGIWYYYYGDGKYGVKSTPPITGELKLGDANGDNEITMLDVVEIQKHIASIITLEDACKKAADVNSDGKITMVDVTTIQKYIAGIITSF